MALLIHAATLVAVAAATATAFGTPDCALGTPCGEGTCAPLTFKCRNNKCYDMFNQPAECQPAWNVCGANFCPKNTMCGHNAKRGTCLPINCASYHDDSCADGEELVDVPCPGGAYYEECKGTKYFKCSIGPNAMQTSCSYKGPAVHNAQDSENEEESVEGKVVGAVAALAVVCVAVGGVFYYRRAHSTYDVLA